MVFKNVPASNFGGLSYEIKYKSLHDKIRTKHGSIASIFLVLFFGIIFILSMIMGLVLFFAGGHVVYLITAIIFFLLGTMMTVNSVFSLMGTDIIEKFYLYKIKVFDKGILYEYIPTMKNDKARESILDYIESAVQVAFRYTNDDCYPEQFVPFDKIKDYEVFNDKVKINFKKSFHVDYFNVEERETDFSRLFLLKKNYVVKDISKDEIRKLVEIFRKHNVKRAPTNGGNFLKKSLKKFHSL